MQKFFLFRYWKTLFLLVLIVVLSTVSFNSIPRVASFSINDKLAHFALYAALGFVVVWESARATPKQKKQRYLLLLFFLILAFFGGVIEIVQEKFLRSRSGELLDWLADILGLLAGFGLGKLIFRNK